MNDSRCTLICCTFDRERANRGPGRRSLTPLYSPAAATRDAAVGGLYSPAVTTRDVTAGGSTSSAVAGAPEPLRCRLLGSQAALDTFPGPVVPGAGAPAATTLLLQRAVEPRLVFPSERMKRVDGFFDDCFYAGGWGFIALVVVAVLWAVTR